MYQKLNILSEVCRTRLSLMCFAIHGAMRLALKSRHSVPAERHSSSRSALEWKMTIRGTGASIECPRVQRSLPSNLDGPGPGSNTAFFGRSNSVGWI